MMLPQKRNATVADAIVGKAVLNAYATVVNIVADLDVVSHNAAVSVVGTSITDDVIANVFAIIDTVVADVNVGYV